MDPSKGTHEHDAQPTHPTQRGTRLVHVGSRSRPRVFDVFGVFWLAAGAAAQGPAPSACASTPASYSTSSAPPTPTTKATMPPSPARPSPTFAPSPTSSSRQRQKPVTSTPSAGNVLDFASSSTRVYDAGAPHGGGSYVQTSGRNRIDRRSWVLNGAWCAGVGRHRGNGVTRWCGRHGVAHLCQRLALLPRRGRQGRAGL